MLSELIMCFLSKKRQRIYRTPCRMIWLKTSLNFCAYFFQTLNSRYISKVWKEHTIQCWVVRQLTQELRGTQTRTPLHKGRWCPPCGGSSQTRWSPPSCKVLLSFTSRNHFWNSRAICYMFIGIFLTDQFYAVFTLHPVLLYFARIIVTVTSL